MGEQPLRGAVPVCIPARRDGQVAGLSRGWGAKCSGAASLPKGGRPLRGMAPRECVHEGALLSGGVAGCQEAGRLAGLTKVSTSAAGQPGSWFVSRLGAVRMTGSLLADA